MVIIYIWPICRSHSSTVRCALSHCQTSSHHQLWMKTQTEQQRRSFSWAITFPTRLHVCQVEHKGLVYWIPSQHSAFLSLYSNRIQTAFWLRHHLCHHVFFMYVTSVVLCRAGALRPRLCDHQLAGSEEQCGSMWHVHTSQHTAELCIQWVWPKRACTVMSKHRLQTHAAVKNNMSRIHGYGMYLCNTRESFSPS